MNTTLLDRPRKQGMTPAERAFLERVMSVIKRLHTDWDLKPGDFAIEVTPPDRGGGTMFLDNIFHAVQRNPGDAEDLILRFLQAFQLTLAETHDQPFSDISSRVFLAVRNTACLNWSDPRVGKGFAFRWCVAPDMEICWVIDLGDRIAHVSKDQLRRWIVDERDVTRIAYENSVRTESDIDVQVIPDHGLIISSRSSLRTVAHLLYWLPNLTNLVRRQLPALLTEPVLVSVPSPMLVVVTDTQAYPLHGLVRRDVHEQEGRILSETVYVFHDNQLFARVAGETKDGIYAIPLTEYGFHTPARESMPYVPE